MICPKCAGKILGPIGPLDKKAVSWLCENDHVIRVTEKAVEIRTK